jgi:hypothetical protein
MGAGLASAEPFDFTLETEQVSSRNHSREIGVSLPSHSFYVPSGLTQVEASEPLFKKLKPLPLPEGTDSEKGKRPRFWRDTFWMYGAVWAFTFTVNYGGLGNKISREASFKKLGHHFVTPPELNDRDPFVTNFIAHPMFGGFTYHVFRHRGHTVRQSMFASALQSTLFEYAVEGFIQRPSGMDLVVTPLIGVPVGARLGKWILPVSVSFIVMKYLFRSPL